MARPRQRRLWDEHRIFMLIPRRAATQKHQRHVAVVENLMHCPRWDRDRIAWPHVPHVIADRHLAAACEDVVNLLGLGMIMSSRRRSRWQSRLGQTLITNARIAVSK